MLLINPCRGTHEEDEEDLNSASKGLTKMNKYSLDLLLVPLSIFINASYHFYLWHNSKAKHPKTVVGSNFEWRRQWIQSIIPADNEKALLAVQTSRNSLLAVIVSASIAFTISAALASLASHHLATSPEGSQTGDMLLLKYSSTSLLLTFSFLCSSRAVGCIVEANFFMLSNGGEAFLAHTEERMMKGAALAAVGNRALYVGVSSLLWMFGPVALVLSTLGMVSVFYTLDFKKPCLNGSGKKMKNRKLITSL